MTIPQPNTVRRFDLPRVFAVFFKPRRVFAQLADEVRPTWSTPMLLLSLTAILVVVTAGFLRTRAAMMGEISLPPDWQWWSPEMQNNYMQAQQATQGPVFMYIMPLAGSLTALWLGWLVLAGLLHLGSTLLGGRGSMQNALNVVAWASLPFLVRDVLRLLYMLIAGHVLTSPGLSGFSTGPGVLFQILSRTDIFLIWNVILLVTGFAMVDGLTRGKSFVNAFVVLTIVILAQAGLSMIGSNLSGTAIQRPFF